MSNYVWRTLEMFASHGDAEAIVAGDRRITYAELRADVLKMAATLREHGIGSGMGVAVLAANPPSTITLHLALHLLGCRSVWIAKTPRRHQLEFLQLANVDFFIYDPATHGDPGGEFAKVVSPLPVYCLGPGGEGPDLLTFRPTIPPPRPNETVDEPLSLYQTSGTTGRPKLVHHRHLLFQALPMLAERWVAEGRPMLRHLSIAGHFHVAAQMTALIVLCMGGTMVLHNGFEPPVFLGLVERERISSTVFAPPMLYELLDSPALDTTDISSLLVITCGGSYTTPARLGAAIDRLGPIIRIVYAMSESPGITEMTSVRRDPDHPERLRSCGLPYGDVQVEIRDKHGNPLGPEEIGEVWISSVLVMAGYWGQPDLTAETLVDGWLRTGDVGYRDRGGYLYLTDRLSDVIITGIGSTNVYTRPIEDALTDHPEVKAASVIGVPDPEVNEVPFAFVVTAPDATVTPEQLRQHVVDILSEPWAPREYQFIDALPLVAMGKVDKRALRERYRLSRKR